MGGLKVDGTKFGEITIKGKPYDSDMVVYWNGKLEYRDKEHVIEMGEFLKVAEHGPDILVIGTGQTGSLKITQEVKQMAEDRNIEIYMDNTPKAIKIYNAFSGEGRKVAGIFHVTC